MGPSRLVFVCFPGNGCAMLLVCLLLIPTGIGQLIGCAWVTICWEPTLVTKGGGGGGGGGRTVHPSVG